MQRIPYVITAYRRDIAALVNRLKMYNTVCTVKHIHKTRETVTSETYTHKLLH